jgi:DNA-binding SARP family transcriptional activator
MARWSVNLFGVPRLINSNGVSIPAPLPLLLLIGFLTTKRDLRADRSIVITAIWPEREEEKSRHCLATTLWRSKAQSKKETSPILIDGDTLTLSQETWVDTLAFDALLQKKAPTSNAQIEALRDATQSYHGPFLDGQSSDWIAAERERLRCAQIDALLLIAQIAAEKGDWLSVIEATRKICALEPLREDSHRLLMTAYNETGNRGLALKQFQTCRQVLQSELQIGPMPITIDLINAIYGSEIEKYQKELSKLPDQNIRNTLLAGRNALRSALNNLDQVIANI